MLKRTLGTIIAILVFTVICSAQSTVYFPQFVDGVQGNVYWGSIITVTNPAAPGTPAATGTVTVTANDGTPWNLTFSDQNGASLPNTFQLAGGQTQVFVSPSINGADGRPAFNSGFATVTSSLPVTGGLVFFEGNSAGLISQAGVQAATPLTKQAAVVVLNSSQNTGVAVANPGAGTSTVTFQLLDENGSLVVPAKTETIGGNNQTAFFVTDLFPTINANTAIAGTLSITSTKGIAAMALLIALPQGLLASIPVFPIQ